LTRSGWKIGGGTFGIKGYELFISNGIFSGGVIMWMLFILSN
jgi:hypothetical protein